MTPRSAWRSLRACGILLALVPGCREAGQIDLAFDHGALAACGAIATTVVYAEPGTTCELCACGGCFGARPGGVVGCTDCSDDPLELSLSPGHWVVVLEGYDAGVRLVGSQCLELDVDRDGTRSATESVDDSGTRCAASCEGVTDTRPPDASRPTSTATAVRSARPRSR